MERFKLISIAVLVGLDKNPVYDHNNATCSLIDGHNPYRFCAGSAGFVSLSTKGEKG